MRTLGAALFVVGGLWVAACGSSVDSQTAGRDADAGLGAPLRGDIDAASFEGCATAHLEANPVPLDVLVMLDASESMLEPAQGGSTKWEAVRRALTAFAKDDRARGIALALQLFPLTNPSVPETCTTDAQCGAYGPCGTRACKAAPSDGFLKPCRNDADCSGGAACVTLGVCSQNLAFLCTDVGGSCGGSLGACIASSGSTCADRYSCRAADYEVPRAPFSDLPAGLGQIETLLANHRPIGDTPTAAALEGALTHARARRSEHPERRVVVVLATDGLPTRCHPTDAEGLGRIAARAAAEVNTFAIGVFAPEDTEGRKTVDAIAKAGGTGAATLIDARGDVGARFREAMDTIRGASVGCDFDLPKPDGKTPDYAKLNVELTTAAGKRVLPYVGRAEACDASSGGWRYDVDPTTGAPSRVVLCEASCRAVHDDSNASVDLVLGCATALK